VGVALEGGVPKIVLELAYDAVPWSSAPPGVRARRDETMSFERPTVPEPLRPRRIETDSPRSPAARRRFPLENRRPTQVPSRFGWLLATARALAAIALAISRRAAERASLGDQIGYSRAAHRPGSDRRRGGSEHGKQSVSTSS